MRLRNFDYSSNGAYFVTVCAHNRQIAFSESEKAIIERELLALNDRFPGLTVDDYMIMSDHLHVIVMLSNCPSSLPRIMQAFKSLSTARVKERSSIQRVWQRGYFDRIVRNEMELNAFRKYIRNNPIAAEIEARSLGRASSAPTPPSPPDHRS